MTTVVNDSFLEVKLDESEKGIIRSKDWESENPCIHLLVESNLTIYVGNVDRAVWNSFADCFEEDPVTFFEQNKKALTSASDVVKYKYSIRNKTDEKCTLIWSKELDGAVAKCGEIELSVSSDHSVFEFIRNCVGIVTSLVKDVEEQRQVAKKAQDDIIHFEKEYTKILEGRVAAEEELFAKFHALLNSKKRKIRDLELERY